MQLHKRERKPNQRRERKTRTILGFSLIEITIVGGMMAIIAAIAIPNLIEARKGANESAAISTLRTLVTVNTLYLNATGMYAGSFQNLISAGFLSPTFFPTVVGTKSGYLFSICTDPCGVVPSDGSAYKILAVPASAGTGNRVFTVDDSEALLATVGAVPTPSDQVIDPPTGPTSPCQTGCVVASPPPMPSQVELDAYEASLELLATHRYIPEVDDQVLVSVPSEAMLLFPTSLEWNFVLNAFDTSADGALDWNEMLTADYLTLARVIKLTIPGSDPGPSVGADPVLDQITQDYQTDLAALLALGTADEDPTPPVMITAMSGDPIALLTSLLAAVPMLGWLGTWLLATGLAVAGLCVRHRRV